MKHLIDNKTTHHFDGVIRKRRKELTFSTLKIVGMSSVVLSLLFSLSYVGGTVSYFNDVEASIGNYLRADPIIFSVTPEAAQVDLSQDYELTLNMVPDNTSDPIQYFVTSKFVSGDEAFCGRIHALTTYPFPMNGYVSLFTTDVSSTTGPWTMTLSLLPDDKVPDSSCVVELTYLGWRDGFDIGRSFNDVKKVTLNLFVPSEQSNLKSAEVKVQDAQVVSPPVISDDEKTEEEHKDDTDKEDKEVVSDKEDQGGDSSESVSEEEKSKSELKIEDSKQTEVESTNDSPEDIPQEASS